MANSTISPNHQHGQDKAIWENLKQAIANSSGFKRWQEEQGSEADLPKANLDDLVQRYLRETLATLAY